MPYFINTGMFDGTETTFLFPMLDQDYVVNRIVRATLQDEEEVIIPWRMGAILNLTKWVLPAKARHFMGAQVLGLEMMANWRGRQEKNAIHATVGKK